MSDWPPDELERYISRLYPAYWLKVELPRAFLDKMDQVKVNEAEVRRIESATERFLWELRGPISYVELTNNMEYVIQ